MMSLTISSSAACSCKYNTLLLPFWLFVVLFKLIRESHKLLIMMEYNRHENRLYSYRIGRIRACRIVQMTDWKHSIKYLSVWFVKTLSKWLPFIFFHYTGYSKWRNCSSHLITTTQYFWETKVGNKIQWNQKSSIIYSRFKRYYLQVPANCSKHETRFK